MTVRTDFKNKKTIFCILKKLLFSGIALFTALSLTACTAPEEEPETPLRIPCNAVMYGDWQTVRQMINDNFYENNLAYGAWSKILGGYLDAALKGETLCIRYGYPPSNGGPPAMDASKPLTKWVVVKSDKLDITSLEFAAGYK